MKIQLQNFGPIHRFECDLDKDFHLIVGTNNTGKSYAITMIYLLLKSLMGFNERNLMSVDDYLESLFPKTKKLKEISASVTFSDSEGYNSSLDNGQKTNANAELEDILIAQLNNGFVEKFRKYLL